MAKIDRIIVEESPESWDKFLQVLKPQINAANTSTVCDKTELDAEVGLLPFRLINLARIGLGFVREDKTKLSKI